MKMPEVLKSPIAHASIAIIGGFTLVSLSEIANPGYGPFNSQIPIILGATIFTVFLAYVNAGYDASLILNKQHINHPIRFIVRFLGAAIFAFASYRCFCISTGLLIVYQGALFWLTFDIFLALKRNLAWNYISTWYKTSKLDLLFKGHWIPWILTKIIILLGSLFFLY